jgi:predicted hydrocarbon binding protein
MHGIMFKTLKDHIVTDDGPAAWEQACADAGLDGEMYLAVDSYPDTDLSALVDAYAASVDRPVDEVLTAYGNSAAGPLIETYGNSIVHDTDSALDVVASVEQLIHDVLRRRSDAMMPPELSCSRDGDTVHVEYRSHRQLCAVAKGLVIGVGEYLDDPLEVEERTCMHEGDDQCELVVERAG